MNALTLKQQKPSDKTWYNESGTPVPYEYVPPFERTNERSLSALAKEAIAINAKLSQYKERAFAEAKKLYADFVAKNEGKAPGKGKGGITLFNFDRSIKLELSVNEQIVFDDSFIQLAKAELDALLEEGLQGAAKFVKPIVMKAFETSRGKLDTKRVLELKRHTEAVNHPQYTKAMSFIDKAIRRPGSREYLRVYVKDETGKYVDVQLNFSAL